MPENRFNFIKKRLEALPSPPKGKRAYYYDEGGKKSVSGLVLCVNPSGSKTFQLYKKIKGRPERITLGKFPDMSIENARGDASDINSKISKGQNPSEERRKKRLEKTVEGLFNYYLENHAKVHKKTWQEDLSQYNRHIIKLKNHKLSDLEKSDIQRLHSKLGNDSGQYAANRVLALLHSMFNHGIEWGFCENNPAHGIKKFKEKSRERFLQSDELPRFFKALMEEPNITIRDYILISLLTGARRDNVQCMRWEQINFDEQTWLIPETKNGDSHKIPLVKTAIDLLNNRKVDSTSDWVFPSNGSLGHLVEPRKAWLRILKRANIKDLRLHDLRRSLGSWQAATGASLSVIGKSLAHKNVSTTAIYARLNLDPVRDSMNKATAAIIKAGNINQITQKIENAKQ